MSWKGKLVCADFETVELLPDGGKVASTDFYKPSFRVDSLALSYRDDKGEIVSRYVAGEEAARGLLVEFQEARLLAFNIQFEIGVARCRYPDLKLDWAVDAMRLAQQWDSGGPDSYEVVIVDREEADEESEDEIRKESTSGFGLEACVRRILQMPSHKQEAYDWLKANGVPRGREGANLHLLPADIAERYNTLDTTNTLLLYELLEANYLEEGFDWTVDHQLYLSTASHIVDAKVRGVLVDRPLLAEGVDKLGGQVKEIEQAFLTRFADPIKKVERQKLLEEIRDRKTLRGRKKYLTRIRTDPAKHQEDIAFNAGSSLQLQTLFMDVLGIEPKFFTEKGRPSFKSSMIHQWDEGGVMLGKRRKILIVLKQSEALMRLSETDSRWHLSFKCASVSTGRLAGGN